MAYRIAGIDVHKRMLAVVVSDVEVVGEFAFDRRQFGSTPAQLRVLADWLVEQQVEEVVMESTAQYWRPVWATLEREWKPMAQQRDGAAQRGGTLHLAQAQSNRGPPWNDPGSRSPSSGTAPPGRRAPCTWRRHNRIARGRGASGTSLMPNDWSSGWSPRS